MTSSWNKMWRNYKFSWNSWQFVEKYTFTRITCRGSCIACSWPRWCQRATPYMQYYCVTTVEQGLLRQCHWHRVILMWISMLVTNSMQTSNSVTFYFLKNSFSDVSRKWILPNMIRAGTDCTYSIGQFTPKMKANAVSRLLSSLVWIDQYTKCNRFLP